MSTLTSEGNVGPADARPLTQQEFQMVQRLFSDPFSFPIQFKTWLIAYLEGSDLTLPMGSILGLQSTLGITGVGGGTLGILPAGIIFPFGGDTAPTGSYLCDGGSYAKSSDDRLWQAIGYRWGGSGANFNVPDLRARTPVGKGTNAAVDTVGKTDAVALADRRPQHRHTVVETPHSHPVPYTRSGGSDAMISSGDQTTRVGTTQSDPASTGITVGALTSDSLDAQPFAVVNFIIIR